MATAPRTPVYKLSLPIFNTRSYQDLINGNFSIIEAILGQFVQVNNLLGTWANSTSYMTNDRVVDIETSRIYSCLVDHISPVLPTTFAEDRANNPTRWAVYGFGVANRGAWLAGTAYHINDWVVNGYQYAVCLVDHTGANFANDTNAGRWLVVADLTAPVVAAAASAASAATQAAAGAIAAVVGVSTSLFTPAAGALTITVTGGTGFTNGTRVMIADRTTPATRYAVMAVGTHVGTALTGTVSANEFAGTAGSDWVLSYIGLTGLQGNPGASLVPYSARTSNTILGSADVQNLIDVTSGTFTQTFTAAATLGNGWTVSYKDSGTGIITLDPNGAELIDGRTTITAYTGESFVIVCTGAAFRTVGRKQSGARQLIETQTVGGAVANITFSNGFTDTEFDSLELEWYGIQTSGTSQLLYQFATTGSGGYITSNYYGSLTISGNSSTVDTAIASGAGILVSASTDANAINSFNGYARFPDHLNTVRQKTSFGAGTSRVSSAQASYTLYGGAVDGVSGVLAAISGIRLGASSASNITAGVARLFGYRS